MKLLKFFLFFFISIAVNAQPILTFETHALKAGVDNPMTFCTFSEVGNSGANVKWDFTNLKALKEFTGHIKESFDDNFSLANTELEEFGVQFYYNTSEDGIEQYGYLSKDGKTRVKYDSPFEKVHFPFSFQDVYSKPFAGEYFLNEKVIGQVEGSGQIEADAWGTILLPGNIEYENTLRVKSEKSYTINFEQSTQNVEMVTYRWYNNAHRYPLLVLIETTTNTDGGASTKSTQAAYNLNAVSSAFLATDSKEIDINFSVYPNPATDEFTIELSSLTNGFVTITLTDVAGRVVVSSFEKEVYAGLNTIVIKDEINLIQEGLYIVQIGIDNKIITQEMSIK